MEEVVFSVLAGLPKGYDVAVGVLQFADDLKLDDILPKLLQGEQRVHEQEETEHSASNIQIYGANTGARLCYHCKRPGHIKAGCPKFKKKNTFCVYCNGPSHEQVDCHKRLGSDGSVTNEFDITNDMRYKYTFRGKYVP